MKALLFSSVFYLFSFLTVTRAQLNYKLNSELGYYKSSSSVIQNDNGLLTRLEGKLSYLYETENSSASFNLKARPEFYGLNNHFSSLKFKAGGEYSSREENYEWSINLARQLNKITNTATDINYDIFSLQGNATFYQIEDFPVSTSFGYAYQNVNSGNEQNLDLLFCEAKLNHIFDSYLRTGYGFYAEKFLIENKPGNNYQTVKRTNAGFRFGPTVELNYVREFLVNFQYRFLFHNSDVTSFPSYEQCIKLIAGKILTPELSVFILINYYLRKYRQSSSTDDQLSILYTPINQENFINFKTTYDISEAFNVYIKGGYFRENLIYNSFTFEGWNLLLGIEWGN